MFVDFYIIGISFGVVFGVVFFLLVGIIYMFYLLLVFFFFLVFIVYFLVRINGKVFVDIFFFVGIVYGFFVNVVIWYIYVIYLYNVYIIWMWFLGSFNGVEWKEVLIMFVVFLFGMGFFIWKWCELNLILFGEESIVFGLDFYLYRKVFFGVIVMLMVFVVYILGVIGFVGFVSFYIMCIILGLNYREFILLIVLFGGILFVVVDFLVRIVVKL